MQLPASSKVAFISQGDESLLSSQVMHIPPRRAGDQTVDAVPPRVGLLHSGWLSLAAQVEFIDVCCNAMTKPFQVCLDLWQRLVQKVDWCKKYYNQNEHFVWRFKFKQ